MQRLKRSVIAIIFSFSFLFGGIKSAFAQSKSGSGDTQADWVKPFPAFRIAGNLYYVGTYELGCYLITTPDGNILINSGMVNSAPMIRASIESLGFRFADTRILLTSQAHRDHLGSMAELKKLTQAKFMVDEGDSAVVSDGGKSDYARLGTFAPLTADRYLRNGDTISLGTMKVKMLHHPGHTKGSCSFLFTVSDSNRSYQVLIANLPTIVTSRKFSEMKEYPGIAKDYAGTLASLKGLSFDIWLTPHASQFDLHEKQKPGDPYHPEAFIDRKLYDAALDSLQVDYWEKLKQH